MSEHDKLMALLDAGENLNITGLPESGLSRVWATTLGPNRVPFAMISAYRAKNTKAQNREATGRLLSEIRQYGPTQLIGHYPEDEAIGKPEGEKIEISFLVPYRGNNESAFRQQMANLCGQLNQDSVLYSDGNQVGFLTRSGSFNQAFSKMSADPGKIQQYWSMIRGRKFLYMETKIYTGSFMSNWIVENQSGLKSDMSAIDLKRNYDMLKKDGLIK